MLEIEKEQFFRMQLQTSRKMVVRAMLPLHFSMRVVVLIQDHSCDLVEFRLAYFAGELEVVVELGYFLVF